MSNLRQAAQQALEAWFRPHGINYVDFKPYMEALRAALAEPDSDYERGFVDGMNLQTKGSVDKAVNRIAEPEQIGNARCPRCWEPITTPTPRKPLTVFEIDAIAEHLDKTTIGWATHEFAAAIEKAHGIGEQHE